jgi:hypothetical protein
MKRGLTILFLFLFKTSIFAQNLVSGFTTPQDNYRISSLIFTGVNTSMTTLNILTYNNEKSQIDGGFSILTGVAQIVYASINSGNNTNKAYHILNYSVGTITIISGGLKILNKKKIKNELTFSPFTNIQREGAIVGLTIIVKK